MRHFKTAAAVGQVRGVSSLERTEEGDEKRDGEIHAEAVEDGDNDVVLS